MAVQKSKKSRSKRGMRRAHDSLGTPTLSVSEDGTIARRHHINAEGIYRGREIIAVAVNQDDVNAIDAQAIPE